MAEDELMETTALSKRQQWMLVVGSAVVVAVAFQALTMARNNYSLWRLEFTALELGVALAGSLLASLARNMDERGAAWAHDLVGSTDGWLFHVLSVLPSATLRAAVMTALLSVVNVLVVTMIIYRETVEMPLLAIPVRFLADIPQAILLCLAVRLVVERLKR